VVATGTGHEDQQRVMSVSDAEFRFEVLRRIDFFNDYLLMLDKRIKSLSTVIEVLHKKPDGELH